MANKTDRALGLIGNGRLILIGSNLFLYMLNHEGHFDQLKRELFPIPDNSAGFGRSDGTMYRVSNYGPLVHQLRANPQFNLEYIGLLLQTVFVNLGDELARNQYFDKSPELEFFRHVRNALGHGNRFNFVGKEPSRPATFNGRTLSNALDGQTLFFDYMGPGDALDLLDQIEAHLRSIT
jgi:hypothetical protein